MSSDIGKRRRPILDFEEADTSQLEVKVDCLVYDLYDLTEEGIAAMESRVSEG